MPKRKAHPPGIKIPAIRQLPSGSWFCQLRIDGKSISITDADYDVVVAKAYAYKTGILNQRKSGADITVGEALKRYIDSRRNIISPSTLRGYCAIAKSRFVSLQKRRISTLTQNIVQQAINAESAICAPKTVKNAYRLIESAITYAGGENFPVKLPSVPPSDKPYLTPDQIAVLLDAIRGHEYEVPILLALFSCRRSEIYGLTWNNVDLVNRTIKIKQAVVADVNNRFVEKAMPKNDTSARTIPVCDQLYEALSRVEDKRGRVVTSHPNSLYRTVNRICATNGLPEVGAHGLRHSFASLAYHLGIPAKVAMAIGGWKNDDVMLKVYTHISQNDIGDAAAEITGFFDKNANKNANKKSKTA